MGTVTGPIFVALRSIKSTLPGRLSAILGAVAATGPVGVQEFEIVDGQQRLTTLLSDASLPRRFPLLSTQPTKTWWHGLSSI